VKCSWIRGWPRRGVSYSPSGAGLHSLSGVGAQVGINAVFGLAVGALVRNQIAAVVGVVVYLFVVGPDKRNRAASQVGSSNRGRRAPASPTAALRERRDADKLQGGVALIAWAALPATLGTRLAVRRDIT
jgi:ABC-2 type transport system permease protein